MSRVVRLVGAVPLAIWAILGVALVLRLIAVSYGLPQELYAEENVYARAALRMIEQTTLDPGWYGHPASTLIDGLAGLYAAYGLIGVLTGAIDNVSAVAGQYRADVSDFFLIGRIYTALVGVAVVLATYALARELRIAVFWSAVAALLVAISALMIRYASVVRVDMLQILFLLLIIFITVRALSRPSTLAFVLAGACLGLAVASKYPAIVGVVPIVASLIMLTAQRQIAWRRALWWLVLAAAASLVAAFVVAPYLFINLSGVLEALGNEARVEHLGATSDGFFGALWDYLTRALPAALGPVGTVLGVTGAVAMLAVRRARLPALFFWAYLLFISVLALWWVRWVLPLVPIAAIGAVFVLASAEEWLRRRRPGGWLPIARAGAIALLVLPMLISTAEQTASRATNDDTRVKAIEWLWANVPDGSTVLVESYTPHLSSARYDLLLARNGELISWPEYRRQLRPNGYFGSLGARWCRGTNALPDAIADRDVDYVLLSGSWIDRYRAEADRYPCELAVYEELLDTYPTVRTFDRDDASLGESVYVLETGAEQQ